MASQADSVLRLQGVQCRRGKQVLIENVNITFERGIVTGLVGSNGVGKSTLIATILGDIMPGAGTVTFGGVPVRKLPQRSAVFGAVTEAHGLPNNMTVGGIIRYWSAVHGVSKRRASSLCEKLQVDFLKRNLKKLSAGMRRRVELVLALLPDPEIVLLDEPFNGLDLDGVDEVREIVRELREQEKIVLLTTHSMGEIDQLVEKLYAIHGQQLVKVDFNQGELGSSEVAYRQLRGE